MVSERLTNKGKRLPQILRPSWGVRTRYAFLEQEKLSHHPPANQPSWPSRTESEVRKRVLMGWIGLPVLMIIIISADAI
jgi:hypothetical protein